MTGQELKESLLDGREVSYNGIIYNKVNAIVYRNIGGKIKVSAELLDKNNSCVVIASAEKISEVKHD